MAVNSNSARFGSQLAALLIAVCVLVSSAPAATIRVARDGSGDYLTLQEALDVAASGDVISMAPGIYDQVFTRSNGSASFEIIGYLAAGTVSIIGDDRDTVIIGPEVPQAGFPQDRPLGIGADFGASLTVQSVTIRNLSCGILFDGANLSVSASRFLGNSDGIRSVASQSSEIGGCEFENSSRIGVQFQSALGATSGILWGCNFTNNDIGIDSQIPGTTINDCTVVGGDVGIQSTFSADMTVMNCQVSGQINVSLHVAQGAAMHLFNNHVENSEVCLGVIGLVTGRGNELLGGTFSTLFTNHDAQWDFHDNHILNSGGWSVYIGAGGLIPVVTHDLTNNYWGTNDPAQIAAWIQDNADDSRIKTLIDFDPFHTDPVSTQAKSFGQLRAMFGGD